MTPDTCARFLAPSPPFQTHSVKLDWVEPWIHRLSTRWRELVDKFSTKQYVEQGCLLFKGTTDTRKLIHWSLWCFLKAWWTPAISGVRLVNLCDVKQHSSEAPWCRWKASNTLGCRNISWNQMKSRNWLHVDSESRIHTEWTWKFESSVRPFSLCECIVNHDRAEMCCCPSYGYPWPYARDHVHFGLVCPKPVGLCYLVTLKVGPKPFRSVPDSHIGAGGRSFPKFRSRANESGCSDFLLR